MTQQVVLARIQVPSLSTMVDTAGFETVWEQTGTNTNVNLSTVSTAINNFFNTLATGQTNKIGSYLCNCYNRATGVCTITYYDITNNLNGSAHGGPIGTSTFTLPTIGSSAAVPEGAVPCIGYQRAYGTDVEFGPTGQNIPTPADIVADYGAATTHLGRTRPRARDRGRFFLPAVTNSAYAYESTTNRCVWSSVFKTDIIAAASTYLFSTAGSGSDLDTPVQWSRRNASVGTITHAWMEDAPRYQRRRTDSGGKVVLF